MNRPAHPFARSATAPGGRAPGQRSLLIVLTALALLGGNLSAGAAGGSAEGESDALIRVNQVGYFANGSKRASLITAVERGGQTFTVVTEDGLAVFSGIVPEESARWNRSYPFVYQLDFSSLIEPGTYRLETAGATSVPFVVGGSELYEPLLTNSMAFMRVQRDGPDVDTALLGRRPSHLTDQEAKVYRRPSYADFELKGNLHRVGGPVDVSGGWFDAGDYVKFVQTTSFVESLLLISARDASTSAALPALQNEGRFGIEWLDKMWRSETGTLFYQVGIGDGNYDSILGDHDFWRLPEADDARHTKPGDSDYFVKHRPVLRAGRPGAPISPNLAGRLAASFALCAQVFAEADPELAASCLENGKSVYALADTDNVDRLLSVSPHGYYPESEWRADMELGAVELYLASADDQSVDSFYLKQAARWAKQYVARKNHDSLNLYDVGGLAHYELVRAIRLDGGVTELKISDQELVDHLAGELSALRRDASTEPFRLGTYYGYDQAARAFGLASEALMVDELLGTQRFERLALDQLDWALGDNPWGVSFVIGAGTRWPHCPHHQIANLNGSVDGTPPVLNGAVVGGPNHASEFEFLGVPEEATKCPPGGGGGLEKFSGHGIRYVDAVRAWPTNEPAIDFTILSTLLFQRVSTGSIGPET